MCRYGRLLCPAPGGIAIPDATRIGPKILWDTSDTSAMVDSPRRQRHPARAQRNRVSDIGPVADFLIENQQHDNEADSLQALRSLTIEDLTALAIELARRVLNTK
jgi:hypothetical protein